MNRIPSTFFIGAFCLLVAIRFLVLGELQPESAVLIALSLLLIVNGPAILKQYRQISRLFRGFIAGGLLLLVIVLSIKSLDLAVSTQLITEQKGLLFVPH